jgi:hypothetical protein
MSTSDTRQQQQDVKYSSDVIKRILRAAVADLYRKEPDIDRFSPETAQTEWNLAAHLAPEIAKYFEGYSYDLDVMKVYHDNRRPDIIIHRRGSDTKYNLLVVEVKRNGLEADLLDDARRVIQGSELLRGV